MTNRRGHWSHRGVTPFVEKLVMKKKLSEDPELYRLASPIDLVRKDAPPTLIIHGTLDTLVPVDESRRFVEALREASDAPVLYAEIPAHSTPSTSSTRCAVVMRFAPSSLSSAPRSTARGRNERSRK